MKFYFGQMQKLIKQIKKDHGGRNGICEFDKLELTEDADGYVTANGSYDCPPTFFKYAYRNSKWEDILA